MVAPEPVFDFRPVRDDRGRPVLNEGSPVQAFRDVDFGIRESYAPLQEPGIVLKLAALGDDLNNPASLARKETHPLAEMLSFVRSYGVLGVGDPTGRRESLMEFTVATRGISRCLRLYEAASANGGDGDEDRLLRLYRDTTVRGCSRLREQAFDEVSETVASHLETRAYPNLYRLRDMAGRTVGFERGDGFRDLLGAAYLSLDYLIRDPAARRCEVCAAFMDSAKYATARHCGDACKQKAYRERQKRAR